MQQNEEEAESHGNLRCNCMRDPFWRARKGKEGKEEKVHVDDGSQRKGSEGRGGEIPGEGGGYSKKEQFPRASIVKQFLLSFWFWKGQRGWSLPMSQSHRAALASTTRERRKRAELCFLHGGFVSWDLHFRAIKVCDKRRSWGMLDACNFSVPSIFRAENMGGPCFWQFWR